MRCVSAESGVETCVPSTCAGVETCVPSTCAGVETCVPSTCAGVATPFLQEGQGDDHRTD